MRFKIFPEGKAALEFLSSDELKCEDRERMILLVDINMPGMNGHQFLDALRGSETLRRSIVFMLTSSDHPRDRRLCYDRNVAGYCLKANLPQLLDFLGGYVDAIEFPPADSATV